MTPTATAAGAVSGPGVPQAALRAFVQAIEAGDSLRAANCLSREACLVTPDATAVNGRSAIRIVLAQMAAMKLRVEVVEAHWLVAGDVALGRGAWVGHADGDGSALRQSWNGTVILRTVDDAWKIQIISPWERRSGGPPGLGKPADY